MEKQNNITKNLYFVFFTMSVTKLQKCMERTLYGEMKKKKSCLLRVFFFFLAIYVPKC